MSTTAAVPRLATAAVSVRFDQTVAVDDVSLSVAPGESVAIVGPSGCGKSTLLRAIAGLQDLDDGRIVVDGVDVTTVPTHRRGIGLMFQDHALFAHRSVADNIEFGLEMQNTGRAERAQRVREVLELVDLSGFERRAVTTLSGGEAQRVALARSLAPRPSILLLDEPLGALDQRRRDGLVVDLRRVLRSIDQTVLYVTHDLGEAAVIADRVAIMHHGAIARIDTPLRLWNDPRTEFVARFIGLNVVDFGDKTAAVAPDELIAVTPGELVVGDETTHRVDGDICVTVVGSWFVDGHWVISAHTERGDDLRWISEAPCPIKATVRLRPAPGTALRALSPDTPP